MQIDIDILIAHGSSTRKYKKGEYIYTEGYEARCYHQVLEGRVKEISTHDDGKELIQGVYEAGESFGDPSLILGYPYPSSAVAIEYSAIIWLPKDRYFMILDEFPCAAKDMLATFARKIYSKTLMAQIHTMASPEQRILTFFDKIKQDCHVIEPMLITYTRQQIADFTGLRVETVIRTLKTLQELSKVKIINHKVYY